MAKRSISAQFKTFTDKVNKKTIIAMEQAARDTSDVMLSALRRNAKDGSGDIGSMWTIADKNSLRSIDKWKVEYRETTDTSVGLKLRNRAKNKQKKEYAKYIIGNPYVSQNTAGLTKEKWEQFFEYHKKKLKERIENNLKKVNK